MNKHADVQRDEHWVSNEIDSLRVSERKGLPREKWRCHGGAEQASSTKMSVFICNICSGSGALVGNTCCVTCAETEILFVKCIF